MTAEKLGKIVGAIFGIVFASIIHTWLGLTILNYLGWLPI